MKYRIKKVGPSGWKEYYIQYRYKFWPFWGTTCDMWGCDRSYDSFSSAKEALDAHVNYVEEVVYHGQA